jgi:uncharacterized protein (DUF1697 family)
LGSFAAFLRGINVGGHKATKGQLTAAFESLGFQDVSTFRASGNVLFTPPGRAKPKAAEIEAALEAVLGYSSRVFLRSNAQLGEIVRSAPFTPRQLAASNGKLQVCFLASRPGPAKRSAALDLATPGEPLAIEGADLFWLPHAGMMDAEVDLKALGRLVGPWTMRTFGTVQGMVDRMPGST